MCRKGCFLLTTILFAIVLAACSSSGKKWDPNDYTAKSGDTVYSIAWRYELDPDEFAAWNNLGTSKWINAGQRLHTRKPYNYSASSSVIDSDDSYSGTVPAYQESVSQRSNDKSVIVAKGDSLYGISKRHGVSIQQLAMLNQLKKPYVIQPGQTIFLKPLSSKVSSGKTGSADKQLADAKPVKQTKSNSSKNIQWPKRVNWQQPVKGKIIKKFDRRLNDAKGIDIAGSVGKTIVAAADGKVVYSGEGLISYGKLIIIKHNKTYLSAYAYNDKLLVKEGDVIKAGQKISEMGRKDDLSPRLHFEIRKNGKPVDPLKYLPW